jgi:hypothetical protein
MARRAGWWRWAVVGVITAVLASLPGLIAALPAHPAAISLTQLVDRIRASAGQPYQGFALSSGTAGLPTLPQLSDVVAVLDGETQLRAFYAGPDQWRVDQIGPGTERDLYQVVGAQILWDFGANQITVLVGAPPVRTPRGADFLPPDLARRLLGAVGPAGSNGADANGTAIEALPARRVAGIAAAGLRLRPTDPESTLAHVDIWAEPNTGLPVQVEVTGRGQTSPILVTRFLDLSLTTPEFAKVEPPPGAPGVGITVTKASDIVSAFASLRLGPLPNSLGGAARATDSAATTVGAGLYGVGFTQFLVIPVPRNTGNDAFDRARKAGGKQITYPGGVGMLLSTPLLSLMVLNSRLARRNYILVGLVDPGLLQRAASELSTFTGGRR